MRAIRNKYLPLNTGVTTVKITDEEIKKAYESKENFYNLIDEIVEIANSNKVFTINISEYSRRFQ